MYQVLCGVLLVAAASAAPQYYQSHLGVYPFDYPDFSAHGTHDLFNDPMIYTRNILSSIANNMRSLETMMEDINRHIQSVDRIEKFENGEYKLEIRMNDFDSSEIMVKTQKNLLKIEAEHYKDPTSHQKYMYTSVLPPQVDVSTGKYAFNNKLLTIVFKLKENNEEDEVLRVPVTESNVNVEGNDREEMEAHDNAKDEKFDIETFAGSEDNKDILTNEIPTSNPDSTTYSVISKDVDFYPYYRNDDNIK